MLDLFQRKSLEPMLIGHEVEPFDDEDSLFELKLDGIRCIAYIERGKVTLKNKRNKDVTLLYPELQELSACTNKKVILDGEIIVFKEGKPDFFSVQKRSLLTDAFKIRLATKAIPVHFVAFDILYIDGKDITQLPLIKRKQILNEAIKNNASISISRYILERGKDFFKLVKENDLEGIVGKKIDSFYYFGKRTKDWKKIKVMIDEDLIICGYQIDEDGNLKDLILGEYDKERKLIYRGKVYLGISREEKKTILDFAQDNTLKKATFPGQASAVWIKPELVGTVHYMQKTKTKSMRQPVWKGLRLDKSAEDYI